MTAVVDWTVSPAGAVALLVVATLAGAVAGWTLRDVLSDRLVKFWRGQASLSCDRADDRAHEAVIAEERAFHAINDEEVGHG